MVKNLPAKAGDTGSIPGLGGSLGEGNEYLLQYSRLEKSRRQRSLVDYSSWCHRESDWTEHTREARAGVELSMVLTAGRPPLLPDEVTRLFIGSVWKQL